MKHLHLFEAFVASQKLNEEKYNPEYFARLDFSWDESPGPLSAADLKKWAPVLKALKVKKVWDLIWFADALPDSDNFENDSKFLKSFSLKDTGEQDQDPHGGVDLSVVKYKGLLAGDHSDDMDFQGVLIRIEDIDAWGKIYQEEDCEDYITEA